MFISHGSIAVNYECEYCLRPVEYWWIGGFIHKDESYPLSLKQDLTGVCEHHKTRLLPSYHDWSWTKLSDEEFAVIQIMLL